jgi:hypothetical protein
MRAVEEAYVGVVLKDIDIGEWHIFYARCRVSVVHQLQNVFAACTHYPEPGARDSGPLIRFVQPLIDGGVTFLGA